MKLFPGITLFSNVENMKKSFRFYLYVLTTLFLCSVAASCNNSNHFAVVKSLLKTPADTMPIHDSLIAPHVTTPVVSLKALPVSEKKKKFFQLLLPAVLSAKIAMNKNRMRVEFILEKKNRSPNEKAFLNSLEVKYMAKSYGQLLTRLHGYPVSIALAQAAIESGWGSSRFFLKANNPFGIWSFDTIHQRIEASSNRDGRKIYLRKFNNLNDAVDAYYTMLATRQAFASFRKAALTTQDPYKLIHYLDAYSERGDNYLADLANMIRTNHLEKYD